MPGSLLGGGGGSASGSVSSASGAQVQAAQQAQAANQAFLQQALDLAKQQNTIARGDIKTGFGAAQDMLSPYALGGYNAYDTYLGTVGLATPKGGSFNLAQILNQGRQTDERIKNWSSTSDQAYRDKLLSIVRSRGQLAPWGSPNVAHDERVFQTVAALPTQNIYDVIQRYISDANHMIRTGATVDPSPVQFRRTQAQELQNWLNGIGTLQKPQDIAEQVAREKAELEKLKQDPNYQKYLDYQAGKVDMDSPDAKAALAKFFNTPEYQLLFGGSGKAVDPNASPIERFQADPGFQFELDTGRRNLEASKSSQGLLQSTSFAKDLTDYSQGVANQRYQQYLGNLSNTFDQYQNQLQTIAGMGSNTTLNQANLNAGQGTSLAGQSNFFTSQAVPIYMGMGQNAADSYLAQGAARAGGYLNQANLSTQQGAQRSAAFGNLGTAVGSYFGGPLGGAVGGFLGGMF